MAAICFCIILILASSPHHCQIASGHINTYMKCRLPSYTAHLVILITWQYCSYKK